MGNFTKIGKNQEQIKEQYILLILIKKEFSALCQDKFLLISLIEYSGISLSYSVTHQSH